MKLLKKFWWILVILIVAVSGFAYYQTSQVKQTATAQASVQTVKVTKGSIGSTVSATGSVRSNQKATVSWSVSGKVGKVLVQVGDQVKTDQIIASLDSSDLTSDILNAQQSLVDAKQALEDLQNSKVDMATALTDLNTAQTNLDDAKTARAQLSLARGTKDTILSKEADYQTANNLVDYYQKIYDSKTNKPENDAGRLLALSKLMTAKASRDKALANLNWFKSKPTAQEIADADATLSLAQAKYDDALRTYNRLKTGPTTEEIAAAQNKVTVAQDLLDSVNMKAPFNGTITELYMKTGDLVSDGTNAFRIDDTSTIYVDLSVSEVDINNITIGQSANVTFDAIPGKTYQGKVTDVGQVGTTSSSVVTYTVTIQISDPDDAIKTGMTAAADISTSTITDALLVPTKSIKTVSGKKVVYLTNNGVISAVTVTTGLLSDTMTQILTGDLKEGDTIIANPTSTTTATSSTKSSGGLFGIFGGGGGGAPADGGGAPPAGASSGGAAPASGASSSGSSSSSGTTK